MFLDSINIKDYIPNLEDAILANEAIENDNSDIALRKLFTQLCPLNTSMEDVFIKCATLNQLYSTFFFNILLVPTISSL